MKNAGFEIITTDVGDLTALLKNLGHITENAKRIRGVLRIVHQIVNPLQSVIEDIEHKKNLSDLKKQLHSLFLENNSSSTWFTRIVDHCVIDPKIKNRLNDFMHRIIGPVVKLFSVQQEGKNLLAIEFPNQNMCTVFSKQLGIDNPTHSNIFYLPAIKSETQQLNVTFSNSKLLELFIHMLNLDRGNYIIEVKDCTISINDRRILDTTSKFHLAIICPYFKEYYEMVDICRTLTQGHRDPNCFFSSNKFPKELLVKIASEASTTDAMSKNEKWDVALCNLPQI